jgi:Skp family chaperone for outer membrane proteins|tara:strand:- start:43347 stop:43598 length:252 start_codon:yes stop_codon:yes gene_type:complete
MYNKDYTLVIDKEKQLEEIFKTRKEVIKKLISSINFNEDLPYCDIMVFKDNLDLTEEIIDEVNIELNKIVEYDKKLDVLMGNN